MRSINKGAIAALAGSAVAVIGVASPAFAATSFLVPSDNPHTIPVDNAYNALPFDITVQGYTVNTGVVLEICDGTPSGTSGWDPSLRCDNVTSGSSVPAGANGQATFPASNGNVKVGDFNGVSPGDVFNCISTNEIPPDATPVTGMPGEYTLGSGDTSTATGQTLDPNVPAWTNCQVRASSNDSVVTGDQTFLTMTIPTTFPYTPEAPMAILLPLGAAGLLAGGVVFARRRRPARLAA